MHEIDVGRRQGHVPGRDHARSEQPVDEIDERDLVRRERRPLDDRAGGHAVRSSTKLYAGQGPLSA